MAIAFVDNEDKFASGFGASLASDAVSHAAGNLLVVSVAWAQDGGFPSDITSVTDTAGDTFTSAAARFLWSGDNYLQQWYCASTAGHAANVVTVAFSGAFGASSRGVSVVQISGAHASPADGAGSGSSASGTVATGSITVSGNGMLVAIAVNPFSGMSAGSGFTGAVFADTTTLLYEYKVVSASQTATAGTAVANGAIIGSSWKESAGGGGGGAAKQNMKRVPQAVNRASTY